MKISEQNLDKVIQRLTELCDNETYKPNDGAEQSTIDAMKWAEIGKKFGLELAITILSGYAEDEI